MEDGYCPGCGAEVVASSVFCHKCGHNLQETDEPRQFDPDAAANHDPAPASLDDNQSKPRSRGGNRAEDLKEDLLWEGKYSFKAMMPAVISLTVLGIIAVVATVVFVPAFWWIPLAVYIVALGILWLRYLYMRLNLKYRLTSLRFEHEVGVLRRTSDRIEVIDIDDVTVEQGLIDRMFGTGKIRMSSSDRTHPEIVLLGIDDARAVADLIDNARRKERVRRGLHVEMV